MENCDYEGTMDSCGEFARQQFETPHQYNLSLDDPNYPNFIMGPDCFSDYGARSSNYGMNLPSSSFFPGHMFLGSCQESNIFPLNFEFNNYQNLYENIGEIECHNVLNIGVLDENSSIDKD